MKFDTSEIRKNVLKLAATVKKSKKDLTRQAGRGFLRTIIGITPPATGRANSEARRRGEAAIAADIAKIFVVQSPRQIARFREAHGKSREEEFGHRGARPLGIIETRILTRGEMAAWHASRRRQDGRVMDIHRDVTTGLRKRDLRGLDVGVVTRMDMAWFLKVLKGHVGFLAGGWAKAAIQYGIAVPSWIARHSQAPGSLIELETTTRFRITISNDVSYAGGVKALDVKIKAAVRIQAAKMNRQVRHLIEKAIRDSGF